MVEVGELTVISGTPAESGVVGIPFGKLLIDFSALVEAVAAGEVAPASLSCC